MKNRRVLDMSVTSTTVLVCDDLMQNCRYDSVYHDDQPDLSIPFRMVQQAHRVAMAKTAPHLKRPGVFENPNPQKWQRLGAQQ